MIIPRRMNHLRRDRRGFPIPYTVMCGEDGTPYFTVNDSAKQHECAKDRRCSVCGKRIPGLAWFVGGPLSAFHPEGAYMDNALDEDCARFALQTCPYLAARSYVHRIDAALIPERDLPEYLLIDPTMLPDRPKLFVAVACRRYEFTVEGVLGTLHMKPRKPYADLQFWLNGVEISAGAAVEMLQDVENYVPIRAAIGEWAERAQHPLTARPATEQPRR
jgi:hypothetical protein